jgi:hypothetical protein
MEPCLVCGTTTIERVFIYGIEICRECWAAMQAEKVNGLKGESVEHCD